MPVARIPAATLAPRQAAVRHLLTLDDLSDADILHLTRPTTGAVPPPAAMRGTLAFMFQQPSLRTMSGFALAGVRLGLAPLTINATEDPLRKECDFEDELVQLGFSATLVVSRSNQPLDHDRYRDMRAPLLNGGDGSNEHPAQTMVDIASFRAEGLEAGKRVTLMGNLRDHRVHHSLVKGLQRLGIQPVLMSPPGYELPRRYLQAGAVECSSADPAAVDEVLARSDLVYLTPTRYWNSMDAQFSQTFDLNLARLRRVLPRGAKVFHPLPRITELAFDVDGTCFDAYSQQSARAPEIRQRILQLLLA